jgi:hypothetical protein
MDLRIGVNMSAEIKLPAKRLIRGQRDGDAGAVTDAGFEAKRAAMRFDDASDDCQAKAGSFGFGRA